jgi:hypothetical protein
MIDIEQLAQEAALFPWLDSDCMADETDFFDELNEFEDFEDDE